MKILALELSSARGSMAFRADEVVEESWPNDRKNSGVFFSKLATFGDKYGPADLIMVGLGPGSYAGIRISLAAAMGLATAWRARLMGAPSICAIESAAPDYAVAGDARRDGFFFAEIQDRTLVGEPLLLTEDELRARIVALGALPIFSTEQLPQFKDVPQKFPTAAALARLAASGNRGLSPAPLQPLYLREPSITFPKTTPVEHR